MKKSLILALALGLFLANCKSKVYTQEECESALASTFAQIEEEAKKNPAAAPVLAGLQQGKQKMIDQCMEGKFDPNCLKNAPGFAGIMGCVKK
ncbi:TIGR04454 family lipoprotein [Leptospira bourretii]|uniref:TIGR04454 family lipoprotein n=3 Tax=Leptospira TaxID=171 RepID=A0A4R9IQI7_9LEPT|nr:MULTISPECIES: TIGR04454 family lipoprotein [Leptospira]MCG6142446.1 TIGR04454 family lipoprotein [Leptospira mtsangambouensis]PJZ83255.1 TIGR04454 family lipoprotein [Leptospira harrisiae]PKA06696.1 TIGR04454 family lipoprotein [Leptospira harrisiae]TGK82909.1 TIGR04454 family lipoprotein [Leptospira bourretii]TGK94257.1 TIGR04454 family lipoprotein [Leptospira bourretii]